MARFVVDHPSKGAWTFAGEARARRWQALSEDAQRYAERRGVNTVMGAGYWTASARAAIAKAEGR